MTTRVRGFLSLIAAAVLVLIVYLLLFGIIEWRPTALRNQSKVIALLSNVRPELGERGQIQDVILPGKLVLVPDRLADRLWLRSNHAHEGVAIHH
jgi:hypothetical protein